MAIEIVIPTYNSAATVAATLESVFAQTMPVELITVVDDGSKDATESVVRSFKGVRFIRNEKNLGAANNWNRCMEVATADHVVVLHSDDIILPMWHERCCALLRDAPNPADTIVMLGYADVSVSGKVLNVFRVSSQTGYFAPGEWLNMMWKACFLGAAASAATVYARRAFATLGGFIATGPYAMMPDVPLHFRLAQKYWIAYDPLPLAMMIQFPNSLSKAHRPALYAGNMRFIRETADEMAAALHITPTEVMTRGLFPYFVIDICRPYWSRLANIPDQLFIEPRAISKAAGPLRIALLVVKFAIRLLQVRCTTWLYRPRLTPLARKHATRLAAHKAHQDKTT